MSEESCSRSVTLKAFTETPSALVSTCEILARVQATLSISHVSSVLVVGEEEVIEDE